jgi:hypothetical protein
VLIFAIDPGDKLSAYVVYDTRDRSIEEKGKVTNEEMQKVIERVPFDYAPEFVIEYPQPIGQPMYTQLVDTIFWIGMFVHQWDREWTRMDRRDIKKNLCGRASGMGDKNVRAAIISRFSDHHELGGGKQPEIGTKKEPGPLYGVTADIWAALAVALTYQDITTSNSKALADALK